MLKLSRMHRTIAAALLAVTALLVVAPVAEAGHGHGRRYKGVDRWRWERHDRPVQRVIVRDSGAGPAIAGLIGGFILGAAVTSSAHPVVVRDRACDAPRYRYYDPYCDEWFVSLAAAREHCDYHDGHPWRVRVYAGDRCERTLRWSNGAWYDCDDDGGWRD